MIATILLIAAAVSFALKALNAAVGTVDLMNLGFMFVVLSVLVQRV
jgi:hypothetical protein